MDASAGTDLLHRLGEDGDVDHLVGEGGIAQVDLLGLADNGLHVVVVPDSRPKDIRLLLPRLLGKLQLQGSKALEAQLL